MFLSILKNQLLVVVIIIIYTSIVQAQNANVILGTNAGSSITTGDSSVMIGVNAGASISNNHKSIFIGNGTGMLHNRSENIFIGHNAGHISSSGDDNIFIGIEAGFRNKGTDNVFIGAEAGEHNTTGYDNTFIGEEAGFSNTTGNDNTFIGEDAGYRNTTGYNNTFMGVEAGEYNTTGYRNAFFGRWAGYDNTIGHHNTCIGDSAGLDNSIGIYNTFIGAGTGTATEYTSFNTFVGAYAGSDNNRTNLYTGATRNTYMGYLTGFTNREGSDNTGLGCLADFVSGSGAGSSPSATKISDAVFIGAYASVAANGVTVIGKSSIGHGDNSIAIGHQSSVTAANAIAIGYQTSVTAANEVYIGNSSHTSIGGVVNWTATSDGRFKSNVQEDVVGLDFINQLRPVTYHFDGAKVMEHIGMEVLDDLKNAFSEKDNIRYTGFIAQEVEAAAQNTGYDFSGVDKPTNENDKDYYGLRYAEFVVPLVKATQELSQKVENLEEKNTDLSTQVNQQKDLLEKYEAALENALLRLETIDNQSKIVSVK